MMRSFLLVRLAAFGVGAILLASCTSQTASGTLPSTPIASENPLAKTAFELRDETGRPVPGTHVMRSRESAPGLVPDLSPDAQKPLLYHHGAVQTTPSIYVVYWGFTNATDPDGEASRLTAFYNAIGASSWLNTVTQYYETGPVYITNPSGQLTQTWYDNTNPVPSHPTDSQVGAEATRLAEHFNTFDRNAAYVVATPHGHNYPGFPNNGCAYHSTTYAGAKSVAYTNLPYQSDAGFKCGAGSINKGALGKIDGVTIVGGHELAETQTDPGLGIGGGWWDGNGNEIGDKCAWINIRNTSFGSLGSFPTQPLWSNQSSACVQ